MPSELSPPPIKRRRLGDTDDRKQAVETLRNLPVEHGRDKQRSLRVFSWNVNGIDSFLPPPVEATPKITSFFSPKETQKATRKSESNERPSLRRCLMKWNWPDIVCLQEVKIAPANTKVQRAVEQEVNSPLEHESRDGIVQYDAHYALPWDKYNATRNGGKVHGVCSLVRRDLGNVAVRTVDWDREGRVLMCEIQEQAVVVINVYAVNGTTFDYRDPETGKVIGTRHDRKKAFHTELLDQVGQYESQGWQVLVIGDMNIARTTLDSFPQLRLGEHSENRSDFEQKFFAEGRLIDTFRHVKGAIAKYTYRPTQNFWGAGGDRVDMGLVSASLVDRLADADILDTEEDRGPSDHVPLYVTLRAGEIPTSGATEQANSKDETRRDKPN